MSHIVLTTNGVEGACAAAAVLMAHPNASIQMTSPRHLPKALERLVAEAHGGTVHLCGIGMETPEDDLIDALARLSTTADVVWYAGAGHPELRDRKRVLSRHAKLLLSDGATDAAAVVRALRLEKSARVLLLQELAEEAAKGKAPQNELHRECHDLVKAANWRFFFFGDDSLNEQVIRYLAGLEKKRDEFAQALEQYRRSPDALYPLGASREMKALRRQIGRLGPVPEPVLITGPTGSGKELMAKAVHVTSGRTGCFVAVNCAVLGGNTQLVEDRLFGHVKGAYTGADKDGVGAFEEAHGGTLFLDEVGELPAAVQAQLLRVLEDKEVRPLGTMKTRPVDVRIVAATHRELRRMVTDGMFREDLFYRLHVLPLAVPPLRERPGDMESIAAHATAELGRGGYPLRLVKKDWEAIRAYDWPGNVRQFLNVLKRAAYLQQPVADLLQAERRMQERSEDNGPGTAPEWRPIRAEDVLPAEEVYRAYLQHVLDLFDGNVTRTAKALKIAPNTLRKHALI